MVEQNRVNEENDRSTQRQETEVITGREKGEEAIRKIRTQGEIATKLKPAEEKDTKKRRAKKCDKIEKHKKQKILSGRG